MSPASTASILLAVSFVLVTCGPGLDRAGVRCENVDCGEIPQSDCIDGLLREYQAGGRCEPETGRCTFASVDTPCEHGCFDPSRCRVAGDIIAHVETGQLFGSTIRGDGLLAADADDRVFTLTLGTSGWGIVKVVPAYVDDAGVMERLNEVDFETNMTQWAPLTLGEEKMAFVLVPGSGDFFRCHLEVRDLSAEPLWSKDFSSCWAFGAPAFDRDGFVHVAVAQGNDTTIHKFDHDGKAIWTSTYTNEAFSQETVNIVFDQQGRPYFSTHTVVVALDTEGKERWVAEGLGEPTGARIRLLAVHGDAIYASEEGGLRALDAEDGSARWHYEISAPEMRVWTAPVVDSQGRVHFGIASFEAAKLISLGADGQLAREIDLGAVGPSFINVASDDSLVLTVSGGDLHVPIAEVRAIGSEGERLWQTPVPGIIGDLLLDHHGRVHVYVRDRGITTIQGTAGLSRAGWPRPKGDTHGAGSPPRP